MKLVVGIPSNGEIKSETVTCLIHSLFQTTMSGMLLVFPSGCLIHQNRMAIAQDALDSNYTYIMFIDSDMVFPPNGINVLYSRNKDIIGANYNKRGILPSIRTVSWEGGLILPKTPFKCNGIAAGFMLVKVDVFRKIDRPWFFYEYIDKNEFRGEDYWFCKKAKEKGIEIWCDPTIEVKHIGDYKY